MTPPKKLVAGSIIEAFRATVAAHHEAPALRSINGGIDWSWGEYGERVRATAAGLAGIGLERGDTLALWLTNRPEFHVADLAAVNLGVVPFSIYNTYTAEQAEHVIADAGSRVVVTEPAFLERALEVRDRGKTPLEGVVLVEGEQAPAMSWQELLDCAEAGFDLDAAASAVEPGDLATLIYTSGTTGPPKGVQLTHRNISSQIASMQAMLRFPEGLSAISWLPMAHVAERICTHYIPMALAWRVLTCSDPREIASLLPQVRPGFFFSPPRLWEKLRAGILSTSDEHERAVIDEAVKRVRDGEGRQDGRVQQVIRVHHSQPARPRRRCRERVCETRG
jgi:long-subunit acyl-CoA synthetase (AMP-forming)